MSFVQVDGRAARFAAHRSPVTSHQPSCCNGSTLSFLCHVYHETPPLSAIEPYKFPDLVPDSKMKMGHPFLATTPIHTYSIPCSCRSVCLRLVSSHLNIVFPSLHTSPLRVLTPTRVWSFHFPLNHSTPYFVRCARVQLSLSVTG